MLTLLEQFSILELPQILLNCQKYHLLSDKIQTLAALPERVGARPRSDSFVEVHFQSFCYSRGTAHEDSLLCFGGACRKPLAGRALRRALACKHAAVVAKLSVSPPLAALAVRRCAAHRPQRVLYARFARRAPLFSATVLCVYD